MVCGIVAAFTSGRPSDAPCHLDNNRYELERIGCMWFRPLPYG